MSCDGGGGLDTPLISLCKAGRALVLAVDVAAPAEVLSVLTRATPIGMLHAAGVLRDKMLRFMARDDLHVVCAPKAVAAAHIHSAMACAPHEALCMFSSVSSTFGNVGQANYSAANAYLDARVWSGRLRALPGSSLQLPAVSGSGMGAATFDRHQLESIGGISLDQFASCLSQSLSHGRSAAERMQAPLAGALRDSIEAADPQAL